MSVISGPVKQNFTIEHLPPATLKFNPRNFRRHPKTQRDALSRSIGEHGWLSAPIVNRRTGMTLLDGHARVEEALKADMPTIPVRVVDVNEATERRILASFDRIGELRERDDSLLTGLLRECADEGSLPAGWAEDDLSGLLAKLNEEPKKKGEKTPGTCVTCPECGFQFKLIQEKNSV
jgi:hypothetical protein